MSSLSKITALKKSVFNAANLSGLAAIFLSYSVGSLLGTAIFFIAVIIGSMNKYRATMGLKNNNSAHKFFQILNDPSLTAQILMVAAFINFTKTSYDAVYAPPIDTAYFGFLALAWFFGFLGDDALRRNDKTNFTLKVQSNPHPLWRKTFIYITRNPVFYFTITNMFFASAILLIPDKNGAESFLLGTINITVIITALIAVFYAAYKGFQMISGKITAEKTNDGVINMITVIINFEVATMSGLQGLYWVVLAQLLFAVSNIICLYETRHALSKEAA